MAKELPFFKFDISEWMLGRIQKQSESTQGMFMNLCCKYWHKLGDYTYTDACDDFDEKRILALIKAKIIGHDGEFIFIKFLDKQLEECEETSKKNSIKGLKSAQIRAIRKQQLTTVQPQLKVVQPNSTEEKRIEEIRKEEKKGEESTPLMDELFMDSIKKNYPDMDYQKLWEACERWHNQTPSPPIHLWQWKQKFETWLSVESTKGSPKIKKVDQLERMKNI